MNPEYYTVWNYRRIIFKSRSLNMFVNLICKYYSNSSFKRPVDLINDMYSAELKFIERVIQNYPKSYWLWNHRVWILDNMPGILAQFYLHNFLIIIADPDWKRELKLVHMMLDIDPRNCNIISIIAFICSALFANLNALICPSSRLGLQAPY